MNTMRKALVLLLTLVMVVSTAVTPAYAANIESKIQTKITVKEAKEVTPFAVIDRVYLTASQCEAIYNELEPYDSWPANIVSIVASVVGNAGVGVATTIGGIFMEMNYNLTVNTLKAGSESGKGCQMIIYDNAAPVFLVVN